MEAKAKNDIELESGPYQDESKISELAVSKHVSEEVFVVYEESWKFGRTMKIEDLVHDIGKESQMDNKMREKDDD